MKNIAVLASGGGSDMQSVIDACESGKINGRVVLVVVNKEGAGALNRAKTHGIPSYIYRAADYESIHARDNALVELLVSKKIDLVVLAGYLAIVTPILVNSFKNKIINIHPSLIPKHCGKGYYGIKVHQSVIDSGDSISGATVHYVDDGADTGEIIEQVTVDVLKGDDAYSLQARVLEMEHIILPKVVAMLCKE